MVFAFFSTLLLTRCGLRITSHHCIESDQCKGGSKGREKKAFGLCRFFFCRNARASSLLSLIYFLRIFFFILLTKQIDCFYSGILFRNKRMSEIEDEG